MYSTCLFCNRPLGTNQVLEEFPVGRRVAFDPARGRLWVVCRRCERWNLSPYEERWEVVEACERLFRETRLRVSTDNIGLARLREGLELVRIGEPLRGEFAFWRWGDQFGRRRRRAVALGVGGAAAVTLIVAGGAAAGVSIGGGWYGFTNLFRMLNLQRTATRMRTPDGDPIRVQLKHLEKSRLVPASGGEDWELHLRYSPGWRGGFTSGDGELLVLRGEDAVPVTGRVMARANRSGGSRRTIDQAVRRIEEAGDADRFLLDVTREAERLRRSKAGRSRKKLERTTAGTLSKLPGDLRLAIEMATQEEQERRAMEGELTALEAAWRHAEEVAAIADNLLVPPEVEAFVEREKRRLGLGGGDRPGSGDAGEQGSAPRDGTDDA